MWKMLGLLALGMTAGAAVMLLKGGGSSSGPWPVSAGGDAQVADLQRSLTALDRRVQDLTTQVEGLRAMRGVPPAPTTRSEGAPQAGPPQPESEGIQQWQRLVQGRGQPDAATLRERAQQRDQERITAAGFTRERLDAIGRREEELRVAAMQAQYEAQRSGQPNPGMDIDRALRRELGDGEYERYLQAQGRPTTVRVMEVLATSAAERSGLRPGDEILSYGGTRVFAARDLNALTMASTSSGSVTVEVRRGNQTVHLAVPPGPLGVTAGAGGARQGGGPGGPGGGAGGMRQGR